VKNVLFKFISCLSFVTFCLICEDVTAFNKVLFTTCVQFEQGAGTESADWLSEVPTEKFYITSQS
jgi:hypothetical protein